jgi:hypothetical protein
VTKGKVYNQVNAAGPVPKNNVARFLATVGLTTTSSVTNATVQYLPSGVVNSLTAGGGGGPGGQDSLTYETKFTSQSFLDTAFPDGNYQLVIHTVHDGTKNPTLAVTGDKYPNAPFVTNPFDTNYNISGFNAVVVSNPAAPFTLTWQPLSGGTVNDYIQVQLNAFQDGSLLLATPNRWHFTKPPTSIRLFLSFNFRSADCLEHREMGPLARRRQVARWARLR